MPKIREKPLLKEKLINLQTYVTRLMLDNDAPDYEDMQELLKMITSVIDYCNKRNRF